MSLPITINNTFATQSGSIPLSQLDTNFATVANGVNGIGNGTNSLANVSVTGGSITNVTISGLAADLSVADGGTGVGTLTANAVVIGNGTGAVTVVSPGASGNVLYSNGTNWISQSGLALPVQTGNSGKGLITDGNVASWGSTIVAAGSSNVSGNSTSITSIPSWAKRITFTLSNVSSNGTNSLVIQAGSGALQSTGYTGIVMLLINNTAVGGDLLDGTAGLTVTNGTAAGNAVGQIVFTNVSANTYVFSGSVKISNTNKGINIFTGSVVLTGGQLDRIGISTTSTDVFDSGTINAFWE